MCKGPGASPEYEENCQPETSILGNTLGGKKSQSREVSRKHRHSFECVAEEFRLHPQRQNIWGRKAAGVPEPRPGWERGSVSRTKA